jgi:Tol biopolymer transport system component
MPGKSRKGASSVRNIPSSASLADTRPRRGYTSTSQARRASAWYWIVGLAAALLAIYVGLLLLVPSLLPDWIRIVNPAPPVPPQIGVGTSRISFVRSINGGKERDLFVVNADGSGQEQVTHDLYVEGTASWSPDGRQAILQASIDGVSTVVRLTIGPDNKQADAVQLTADVKADSVLPVWSPDGKMVAFQSKRDGGQYQLFVMDADGNNKRRLSDGTGYAGQPAWSKDGKTIAFIAGKDATPGAVRELFVVPTSGGPPTQITQLNSSLGTPTWSPDSRTIAFLQILGEQDYKLLIVDADGNNLRALAQNGVVQYQQFSPSGDELVYSNVLRGANGIYRVRVTDATTVTVKAGDDYQPTWSPDGKQIAWASTQTDGQSHKIVAANADGTDLRSVSHGDGDDYQPAWSIVK